VYVVLRSSPPPIRTTCTHTVYQPFLDVKTNPSWEIARNLPSKLTSQRGTPFKVIVPESYIPAAYHKILTATTAMIKEFDPDIVIHMGLAVERDYFAIEKSALKEGYHEIPDVARKVLTRAENKKTFGKAPGSLATSFDLESVVSEWEDACATISMTGQATGGPKASKEKGKVNGKQAKKTVVVKDSDDVGTYVCGLMYYVSLWEMGKRGKGGRDAVFLHVPSLDSEQEVGVGIEVTKKAIEALVEEWENRKAEITRR
jgi:pyroglutamyl-peptidase